ncbi:MAG: hypothetical protein QNJ11_09990 [Woeseiaceae bacterium]|nr:hypothetical protein [Woeseiaceae bacterium]
MIVQPAPVPAVILSGGSEVVSLGIAEALIGRGVPLIIVSLGKNSLLRDIPETLHHEVISWPPESVEQGIARLRQVVAKIPIEYDGRLPTFATEDGGLRLLFEGRSELHDRLAVPGSTALKMGGLDKSEFFLAMQESGLDEFLAPTLVIRAPEDAVVAFERFGGDAIFKPALKPFNVVLSNENPKIVTRMTGETTAEVTARLDRLWSASPTAWVAQSRLDTRDGESDWWGARLEGITAGMTAVEYWKSPRVGGSGCWVGQEDVPQLHDAAHAVLDALDFTGVAEMPFLPDPAGNFRLLEINPRPWLQVALPEIAGMPLIYRTYCSLAGLPVEPSSGPVTTDADWVSPERMLAAALSGDYGNRFAASLRALRIIARARYRTVYSSRIPGVRTRWLGRMAAAARARVRR